MADHSVKVAAGKLFCTTRGDYSDYRLEGHFLALQDITREALQEIIDECKAEHAAKEEDPSYWCSVEDLFLPKLIRSGLVVDIDVQEIHTGSYGQLEIS